MPAECKNIHKPDIKNNRDYYIIVKLPSKHRRQLMFLVRCTKIHERSLFGIFDADVECFGRQLC